MKQMARPNLTAEKRVALMPIVARAFAELGYRRTTTAELARRCAVQENILYRLWPDKKSMFVAAIEYVYELSEQTWRNLLTDDDSGETAAHRLLKYEAAHHGEFGHYRIVFAGLSETDDPDIRSALSRMYARFQQFIGQQIAAHREDPRSASPSPELLAWAVVGVGTVANIVRELGLTTERERRDLIDQVGRFLLGDAAR
jgi:AcrR family transcriptional regulator